MDSPARPGLPRQRTRRALVLAACALVLSACARSPASPIGSPSLPSPGRSQVSISPSQEVKAAVRLYLRNDAINNYGAMAKETTGTISNVWTWFDQEYGSCNCPPEKLTITRLRVTRVKDDQATVDLLASLRGEDHVTRFSGPMILVKRPTGWLVQDYRRNGEDFARLIVPLTGTTTVAGVRVNILGIGYQGDGSGTLFYEIADLRSAPIRIEKIALRDGGKMFWATSWGSESARMVDAGSVATRGFDWLRPTPLPKENPDHLEIVVKDLGSGRQFNLTLSMKSA